jgi:hypothetical protein
MSFETPFRHLRMDRKPLVRPVTHRGRWAVFAHLAALGGLLLEQKIRFLTNSAADPYADTPTTALFLFAAAMLLVNEYALRRRWRHVTWLRNLAVVGTAIAMPVALSTTIFLLPFVPLALFAIVLMGMGLLAFVPHLTVGLYIAQWRALLATSHTNGNPIPRSVLLTAALGALLSSGWFIARFAEHGLDSRFGGRCW